MKIEGRRNGLTICQTSAYRVSSQLIVSSVKSLTAAYIMHIAEAGAAQLMFGEDVHAK